MNKISVKYLIISLISALFIYSCAKEVSQSDRDVQKRMLDAYLRVNNYQNIKPIGDGIYILENSEGTGRKVYDSSYVFVRYSTKYLSGEYSSTTYDTVAMLLGNYKAGNFYGSYVWRVGTGDILPAIDTILLTMKEKGKSKAIVPAWAAATSTTSYATTMYSSDGTTLIYELEVDTIVKDINQYELEQLEHFSNNYYGGMDSLKKGFYYKKIYDAVHTDTIPEGSSLEIRYVGKFLDGKLFDTNIADTAKKYRTYTGASGYDALRLVAKSDSTSFAEENSVVAGFGKALRMKDLSYGDRCVVFFSSEWGYGQKGSLSNGRGVPPYYPLFFEIWIEEK